MRFISLFGTLIVVLGLCLHYQISIPWVGQWLGHLPGDMLLHKGNLFLYVPFTSAFIASLVGSFLFR